MDFRIKRGPGRPRKGEIVPKKHAPTKIGSEYKCQCGEVFLITQKGMRYCSDRCARIANLRSKRRWWNENRGAA